MTMVGAISYHRWIFGLLAALSLVSLSGCSAKFYPVKGTVVFDDGQVAKDLVRGVVVFSSEELKVRSFGVIQKDGTFHLTTERPGDGALPGHYRVTVTPPTPHAPKGETAKQRPKTPPLIDPRYQNLSTTDLVIDLEPKSKEVTLRVQRYHPRNGTAKAEKP